MLSVLIMDGCSSIAPLVGTGDTAATSCSRTREVFDTVATMVAVNGNVRPDGNPRTGWLADRGNCSWHWAVILLTYPSNSYSITMSMSTDMTTWKRSPNFQQSLYRRSRYLYGRLPIPRP